MPRPLRVPPGRAGRLWLERRLRTARRGTELLDRKVRILRAERDRLGLIAERAAVEWTQAYQVADTWLVRAVVLGGERELRLGTPPRLAEVTVSWTDVMGVRLPAETRVGHPPVADRPSGSSALVEASVACRHAVSAAVTHAAADAAVRAVESELTETTRRLRAITDRWTPRLEEALRDFTQRLEEFDRAEAIRLRWASRGTTSEARR
ncbi:MAG: V-type ATP synthase subunit D [Actinobacteria bacterium]|nr:V-type ATP synthase subunit D [Actinomycetota bacterium]